MSQSPDVNNDGKVDKQEFKIWLDRTRDFRRIALLSFIIIVFFFFFVLFFATPTQITIIQSGVLNITLVGFFTIICAYLGITSWMNIK